MEDYMGIWMVDHDAGCHSGLPDGVSTKFHADGRLEIHLPDIPQYLHYRLSKAIA
jgi:hypothetical protein